MALETDIAASATKPSRTSALCARTTWVAFHGVGFTLLWASGNWPVWPAGWPFATAAMATLVLYVAASTVDPGFLPQGNPGASAGLRAAAAPLLDVAECVHCLARQAPRTKVSSLRSALQPLPTPCSPFRCSSCVTDPHACAPCSIATTVAGAYNDSITTAGGWATASVPETIVSFSGTWFLKPR